VLAETFRELAGTVLVDDDGDEEVLELLPAATADEIAALEADIPSPLASEIREALGVSKGLANGPIESLSLIDLGGFGMEDVFPHALSIGHDGFGNYWVVDLLGDRPDWGPVFFACHDPPVIAFQSDTVEAFVRDVVALWRPGPRSPVDVVHEDVTTSLWAADHCIVDQAGARASGDPVLAEFAAGFAPGTVFADLRTPTLGDGFAWGRHGPRTEWTRCGAERLWATVPPPTGRSRFARIFGRGGGG
jgi:hypothetical protein